MYKKITVMVMPLIGTLALTLIQPVMAAFAIDFPDASLSTVTLVVSITAFATIPGVFIASALTTRIDRKIIVVLGYILVLAGGIFPSFLNSISLILVCRAVLGLGAGLIMPLQTTYIAEYPEAERPVLFGVSGTINNLSAAAILFLVSLVAASGWRNVFLLYGICGIVLVMILTAIPKSAPLRAEPPADGSAAAADKERGRSNALTMVKFSASLLLSMTGMVALMSYISFYIVQYDLGGVSGAEAGTISSLSTICLAVGAAAFPVFMKRFKGWTSFLFLMVSAAAFLLYSFPVSIITVGIGTCLIFTFISLYATYCSTMITSIMPLHKVAISSAICITSIFAGQFIAPYMMSLISFIMGTEINNKRSYTGFAILLLILALVNMPRKQRKSAQTNHQATARPAE